MRVNCGPSAAPGLRPLPLPRHCGQLAKTSPASPVRSLPVHRVRPDAPAQARPPARPGDRPARSFGASGALCRPARRRGQSRRARLPGRGGVGTARGRRGDGGLARLGLPAVRSGADGSRPAFGRSWCASRPGRLAGGGASRGAAALDHPGGVRRARSGGGGGACRAFVRGGGGRPCRGAGPGAGDRLRAGPALHGPPAGPVGHPPPERAHPGRARRRGGGGRPPDHHLPDRDTDRLAAGRTDRLPRLPARRGGAVPAVGGRRVRFRAVEAAALEALVAADPEGGGAVAEPIP